MFFYNSLINLVCFSESYNSDDYNSLLTFDSFEQAFKFLLCCGFTHVHKSTFYSGSYRRSFRIRKFYGMNYYGIYDFNNSVYVPFDYHKYID